MRVSAGDGVRISVKMVLGCFPDFDAISVSNAGPLTKRCSKNSACASVHSGRASIVNVGSTISGAAIVATETGGGLKVVGNGGNR